MNKTLSTPRPKTRKVDIAPPAAPIHPSVDWADVEDLATQPGMHIPKLSHVLADRLRTQIVTGKLRAGDKLPPEAELTEVFKVSRPTLREALRVLETEGLIVVGRGVRSGATVRAPTMERAAQYAAMVLSIGGATMTEIHDARMALEPALARLLVDKANKSVVKQLRACNNEQVKMIENANYDGALRAINRFHELLVRSSGNPVLMLLVGMLHTLSSLTSVFLIEGSTTSSDELHKNMEKTIAGHQRLVELIEAGNGEGAEAFWSTYMQRAQTFLTNTGLGSRRLLHDSPRS